MRKFLWLLLISSLLLAGCNTTPNNDSAIQQAAKADRRSPETIATDKEIEQTAAEELSQDLELLSQSNVNVNAYNGLALITGEVTNEEFKNKILDIVRVIPHVKMVRDSLTVDPFSTAVSHVSDRTLAGQVDKALKQIQTLPNFNPSMIKVVTQNGVVYLMGLVSKEEGSVVVNVTRLQSGVKQIVTVFEYTN